MKTFIKISIVALVIWFSFLAWKIFSIPDLWIKITFQTIMSLLLIAL